LSSLELLINEHLINMATASRGMKI